MFNIQPVERHALSEGAPEVSPAVFEPLWELFCAMGQYWQNMADPSPHRTQVLNFMSNRIRLDPLYKDYYATAVVILDELKRTHGTPGAYEFLFTSTVARDEKPPRTPLAVTRQLVSNELLAWQLAVGGFKEFGSENYQGYICGPNLAGQKPPYRTGEIL